MIREEKLELYKQYITSLRRGNNNEYYSLRSVLNMTNLSDEEFNIVTRSFNTISRYLPVGAYIDAVNEPIRLFDMDRIIFTNVNRASNNNAMVEDKDIVFGNDLWVIPYIILMLLDDIKSDSPNTREHLRNIIIYDSCIDINSYNDFVSSLNSRLIQFTTDNEYSDAVMYRNRLYIHLGKFCSPKDISHIFREIDKYVFGGLKQTMSSVKQDHGIPKYEDPFIHMDLYLLQKYKAVYIEVMNRISGLATAISIKKEVEKMVHSNINSNNLSMNNNNTLTSRIIR